MGGAEAEETDIVAEVVAAAIGGMFSASALYPLEVIKTKMQAEMAGAAKGNDEESVVATTMTKNKKTAKMTNDDDKNDSVVTKKGRPSSSSAVGLTKSMYQEGGIPAFYGGIETSAIQAACEKAFYFFAYTFLKNGYSAFVGHRIGAVENLALGCAAEWAHLPITMPIDCLTTRIQTDESNSGAYALMCSILSEKGVGGMYNGIQAYTVLCLKPAIQYTVFEQVKRVLILSRRGNRYQTNNTKVVSMSEEALSATEAFCLGIIARTISTIIVFPYTRAKVMLQSTARDKKQTSIPSMLKQIFDEGGISALFQGLGPELTRGVLSTALMMVAKEKIAALVAASLRESRTKNMQR